MIEAGALFVLVSQRSFVRIWGESMLVIYRCEIPYDTRERLEIKLTGGEAEYNVVSDRPLTLQVQRSIMEVARVISGRFKSDRELMTWIQGKLSHLPSQFRCSIPKQLGPSRTYVHFCGSYDGWNQIAASLKS